MKKVVMTLLSVIMLVTITHAVTLKIIQPEGTVTVNRPVGNNIILEALDSAIRWWKVESGGVVVLDNQFTMPNNNVEIRAMYSGNVINVIQTSNGSISPAGPMVEVAQGADQKFTITPNTGYQITGVTVDGSGQGAITEYTFSNIQANHKITATYIPVDYGIGYTLNGGTVSPANPETYNIETPTFTLNNPTRTGYDFDGWSGTGISGTSKTVTIEKGSYGARSYTANWTPWTYTIAYNANGGTGTTASSTHTYDVDKALTANGFSKTGHCFKGWATSSGGSKVYNNSQTVKNLTTTKGATVTLYAVWEPCPYTVAYNANGGTGTTSSSSHTYGVEKALTTNGFSKTGYRFLGWDTSSNGTTVVYTDGQSVSNLTSTHGATVTLYAVWEARTYTVVYHANGGTGTTASSTHYIDIAKNLTANGFSKRCYKFIGWDTSSSGTTVVYTNSQSVTNLTTADGTVNLYAVWAIWYATELPVGSYVQYTPAGGTVTALATDTEYTSDQTFTPSSYTGGWKILYNNKGYLELVSAESVASLYLGNGMDTAESIRAWAKIVYTLNKLCNGYATGDFASEGRIPLSNGQVPNLLALTDDSDNDGFYDVDLNKDRVVNELDFSEELLCELDTGADTLPFPYSLTGEQMTEMDAELSLLYSINGVQKYWSGARIVAGDADWIGICTYAVMEYASGANYLFFDSASGIGANIINAMAIPNSGTRPVLPIISLASGLKVTGGSGTKADPYTVGILDSEKVIKASAGENGSITPGTTIVANGGSQTFTITPDSGYRITDVLVDGTSQGAITSYTFSNVTANHTIEAVFDMNGHTITVVQPSSGTISPGTTSVAKNSSATFTLTPNEGFEIEKIVISDEEVLDAQEVNATFNYVTDDVFTIENDATYPWVTRTYVGFKSGNGGQHSTTSTCKIKLSGTGTLTFYWYVSSESGYDKFTLKVTDDTYGTTTECSGTSGTNDGYYSKALSGNITVELSYTKDSGASSGEDCAYITNMSFVGTCVPALQYELSGNTVTFNNVDRDFTLTALFKCSGTGYTDGSSCTSGHTACCTGSTCSYCGHSGHSGTCGYAPSSCSECGGSGYCQATKGTTEVMEYDDGYCSDCGAYKVYKQTITCNSCGKSGWGAQCRACWGPVSGTSAHSSGIACPQCGGKCSCTHNYYSCPGSDATCEHGFKYSHGYCTTHGITNLSYSSQPHCVHGQTSAHY